MIKSPKTFLAISFFVFGALLVMAILFFKERIIFLDMAYIESVILVTKSVAVMPARFGGVIPQVIPLLGQYFHLPLKEIFIIHSAGMIFFYLIIFSIIVFRLKNYLFGFALLFFLTLMCSEGFYWISGEYQQGMAYLCLYGAWLSKKMNIEWKNSDWWKHLLFLLWIHYFYLLMLFPILFLFSFLFFSSEKRARKAFFILGSFACISFIVRYIAGTFDWYESGKLSLVSSIGENLPHLFQLNSFKQFLHDLTGDYLLWLLIMILNLIVLLREKKYWLIASLFGITISYLLLVYTFNPGGAKFYIQNMTMPLGFMAALPFLFYFISKIKIQFAVAILALIFAIRLVVIYSAHEKFTARISWYETKLKALRSENQNVIYVSSENFSQDTLIMNWASVYETLLLSSLNNPDSVMIIKMADNDELMQADSANNFYGPWKKEEMPVEYFNLNKK